MNNDTDPTTPDGDVSGVVVTDKSAWLGNGYNALTDFRVSNLDIDGNGQATLSGDAMLLVRWKFGLRGDSLTDGLDTANCTRCTPDEISAYIDTVQDIYDVDDSGNPTLGGDCMIILRHMFGLRGDAMIEDLLDEESCQRCSADEINEYIRLLIPD